MTAVPDGFDCVDLGELLDVIDALLDYSRAGTLHEDEGEDAVHDRASRVLRRYRDAI